MTNKPIVSPYPQAMPKNPLFKGMLQHLKDPANFEKIYKAIYEAGVSKCSHSEVSEYAHCFKCAIKAKDRSETMKKLGFTSGKQYLMWLKVHQRIRDLTKGIKPKKGEYYDSK